MVSCRPSLTGCNHCRFISYPSQEEHACINPGQGQLPNAVSQTNIRSFNKQQHFTLTSKLPNLSIASAALTTPKRVENPILEWGCREDDTCI
jgi:hypothetical protein